MKGQGVNIMESLSIPSDKVLLTLFMILTVACCNATVVLESPFPIIIPMAIVFLLFVINNPKNLFYLFWIVLPFSIEVEVGSLGTDLPTEPIMMVLMGIFILLVISKPKTISKSYFLHPVSILIYLHLSWILITTIFSTNCFVSFKYLLAKLWYIIPFYFLPFVLFKDDTDFRKCFRFLGYTLFVAILYVFIRHAASGFYFDAINKAVRPIFRNHVNYAIIILAYLPYYCYLIFSPKKKAGLLKWAGLIFLVVAIYLTYTRAAQASMILAIGIYFVIKMRLIKYAVGSALVLLLGLVMFLSTENKYLDFAPDFNKTIAHKNFDNLVEATAKMEDISTVERFYRWVAGFYMVAEKPLVGFGPSTFYTQYKQYTVSSYKTYVSDNPEKSGIHNNYLMVAVEQGYPGLLIMLSLVCIPLLYAEKTYHNLITRDDKLLVMVAATSYAMIAIVILINDLLEADKVGPFFFLSASIIVFMGVKARSNKA